MFCHFATVILQYLHYNNLQNPFNYIIENVFELYTAGQFKRTVTMFGENTPEGKAKFEEELQQTHELFKHFVEKYRPQLNVEKVATGEHWYGRDALDLNLVDKLQTSDEYLLSLLPQHDVYVIQTRRKPTLGEKIGLQAAQIADQLVPSVMHKVMESLSNANANLVQMRDPKL